jgi:hypothetical protein
VSGARGLVDVFTIDLGSEALSSSFWIKRLRANVAKPSGRTSAEARTRPLRYASYEIP